MGWDAELSTSTSPPPLQIVKTGGLIEYFFQGKNSSEQYSAVGIARVQAMNFEFCPKVQKERCTLLMVAFKCSFLKAFSHSSVLMHCFP